MVYQKSENGVAELLRCGDCAKFKPDSENPKGGLGDCEAEKHDVLMRSWENHKGRLDWHWHYQKKLTYPGSEACGEYKEIRRTKDDNNARA